MGDILKNDTVRVAEVVGKWIGGGVESVLLNYYRNINRENVQLDFICDSDSTNIPYKEIEKLGGKVIIVPPYQKMFQYHKILKKIFYDGNYKIVHSHINTLSVFSLFAAKCAHIPIRIAHSHSTSNKKEWKKNLMKLTLRPFIKFVATNYMACTEHAGRWMFGNKEYDKGNVYILNNAIDFKKFKFDNEIRIKKRKELGISDDIILIGHVGRFVEQKNHRFLIDVFNELHKMNEKTRLMLIGAGPLMNEIKIKVDTLGLSEYVFFLGQVDSVNDFYQAMDLFFFPSLYEGLGMVMIEAQVAGLPCIASTEVPKIAQISDDVYFLRLEERFKDWAKKCMLYNNIEKRKNNLKELKGANYNIEDEANKLENYYLRLICKGGNNLNEGNSVL